MNGDPNTSTCQYQTVTPAEAAVSVLLDDGPLGAVRRANFRDWRNKHESRADAVFTESEARAAIAQASEVAVKAERERLSKVIADKNLLLAFLIADAHCWAKGEACPKLFHEFVSKLSFGTVDYGGPDGCERLRIEYLDWVGTLRIDPDREYRTGDGASRSSADNTDLADGRAAEAAAWNRRAS
jgi:hypothetical protein